MFIKRVAMGLGAGLLAAVGSVAIPDIPEAGAIDTPDFGSVEEVDLGDRGTLAMGADEAAQVVYVLSQPESSSDDLWFRKISSDGTIDWARRLTGTRVVGSVEVGPGGDVWVTARNRNGQVDVRRFTPQGVELWGTALGGNSLEICQSLAVDTEGNSYCGGLTNSTDWVSEALASLGADSVIADGFVVKIDPDGDQVWAKGMTGPITDPYTPKLTAGVKQLAVTASGKVLVFSWGDRDGDGTDEINATEATWVCWRPSVTC